MSGWTKCSCGHIAQDHNRALDAQGQVMGSVPGPVSGRPRGYWTKADCDSIAAWGCDQCDCNKYNGEKR
jgi:hypothetical protein